MSWEGLSPPYRTIVADPPWAYSQGWPMSNGQGQRGNRNRRPLAYSTLSVEDIAAMPVAALADDDATLFLWTTNRYLRESFDVLDAWGFAFSQTLVWVKPRRGLGPGGTFANTTEFVQYARKGSPETTRCDSTWFAARREGHSVKPASFYDAIEAATPSPRVELFARQPRLGWDHWGYGYEGVA